jgi:hypothetical protein
VRLDDVDARLKALQLQLDDLARALQPRGPGTA